MKIPPRILSFIGRAGIVLLVLILVGVLGFGTWLFSFLTVFGDTVSDTPLHPDIRGVASREAWEAMRPEVLEAFQTEIYGTVPTNTIDWNVTREVVDENAYEGRGTLEVVTMESPDTSFRFSIVLAIPNTDGPAPLVLTSNFCPNHLRFPELHLPHPASFPSMCGDGTGIMGFMVPLVFGEYIETFPVSDILDHRIAFAGIYLGEGVPDDAVLAPVKMKELSALIGEDVTGTIAAWAWEYNEALRVLEDDVRIDADKTALYGHSRDGKAVLLASAVNESVDLVLAHQSGKGGASSWERNTGEPITSITKDYPHWFTPSFASYAGKEETFSVGQHELIALSAPRPVLITGARQDKWGDPKGALMASRDAAFIYRLYGVNGPQSTRLDVFQPTDELAFFMRESFHGVRPSDWNAFLTFMDAHFSSYEDVSMR